jgi:hypothetical protein
LPALLSLRFLSIILFLKSGAYGWYEKIALKAQVKGKLDIEVRTESFDLFD